MTLKWCSEFDKFHSHEKRIAKKFSHARKESRKENIKNAHVYFIIYICGIGTFNGLDRKWSLNFFFPHITIVLF